MVQFPQILQRIFYGETIFRMINKTNVLSKRLLSILTKLAIQMDGLTTRQSTTP